MKIGKILKIGLVTLTIAGSISMNNPALAQGPGGGMPPEIAAKIKLWTKWRESHKNLSNLQTMLYQVRKIDESPGTELSKDQSKKVVSVLKTWRNKQDMSEDQAKSVSKQIGSVLSEKQLKKMATEQPPWARGGGGGGGRPGGGGGGARPGGGAKFTFPDPPAGGYNPLNPDTLPFVQMRPQAKHDGDAFISSLDKRAKG